MHKHLRSPRKDMQKIFLSRAHEINFFLCMSLRRLHKHSSTNMHEIWSAYSFTYSKDMTEESKNLTKSSAIGDGPRDALPVHQLKI